MGHSAFTTGNKPSLPEGVPTGWSTRIKHATHPIDRTLMGASYLEITLLQGVRAKTGCLGIMIMCSSEATYLPVNCRFSKLAQ